MLTIDTYLQDLQRRAIAVGLSLTSWGILAGCGNSGLLGLGTPGWNGTVRKLRKAEQALVKVEQERASRAESP